MLYKLIPHMADFLLLPLVERFDEMLANHSVFAEMFDLVVARRGVWETVLDHACGRIRLAPFGKQISRVPAEAGHSSGQRACSLRRRLLPDRSQDASHDLLQKCMDSVSAFSYTPQCRGDCRLWRESKRMI